MRLLLAVAAVAVLFAISPIAGGVAAGLVGALFVVALINRPHQIAAAQAAQIAANRSAREAESQERAENMSCPLCQERIKLDASVCRHCQAWKCDKCFEWSRSSITECTCVPCESCDDEHVRPGEPCMYDGEK